MVFFEKVKESKEYFIQKKGKYLFFLNNFSGNLKFILENKDCQVFIFGVYLGKKKEEFTLNTFQIHRVGDSFSNLLIKGVFLDESRFFYQGLIKIEKGADNTFAYQKNQNLLLSENCKVESKPYLEILANDVFCTHGATTSNLDKEQIFYLKTRGLNEKKATLLLSEGFLFDVFWEMEKILGAKKVKPLYKETKEKLLLSFKSR
jgi:Fe-S cluster assembly scaffold protein SufB